ncbi:MAG: hypothetical protein L0Z50_06625, partial [Verrucomicrobiales bacterium]|nr:hypothetical protein [Verrucomicrobiales bacterium]
MLSERPWRPELVLQFLLVVMVGWFIGMMVMAWLTSEQAPVPLQREYVTIIGGALSFHGIVLA